MTDEDKVGEFEWWMVPVDKKVEKEEEILGMDRVAVLVEGIREPVIRYNNGTVCGGGNAAGEVLMIAFVLAGWMRDDCVVKGAHSRAPGAAVDKDDEERVVGAVQVKLVQGIIAIRERCHGG